MARSKKFRSRIGAVIFVLFIAGTGTALAANNRLHNPFEVVPRVLGMADKADAHGGGGEGEMRGRPDGDFAAGERPEPPAGFEPGAGMAGGRAGGEGGEQGVGLDSIRWSQIGGVLYNMWVIGAAAAVVMVVGTPTGRLIKRFRRTKKPTASDAPPVPDGN